MKYKVVLTITANLLILVIAITVTPGQSKKSGSHRISKNAPQNRQTSSRSGFAEDYKSLIKKLRAGGAAVKPGERVSQPFFSVAGRVLNVKGEQIQVFEYAKAETAGKESGQVSTDGSPVGTTMVNWIAPPHFYKSGRLIVLYIGENSNVIKALEKALGRQFAGK